MNGEARLECRDVSADFIYTRHAVEKSGVCLGAASADCCCSSAGAINNAAPPCSSVDLTMRTCITFELRFCITSARRVRRHALVLIRSDGSSDGISVYATPNKHQASNVFRISPP